MASTLVFCKLPPANYVTMTHAPSEKLLFWTLCTELRSRCYVHLSLSLTEGRKLLLCCKWINTRIQEMEYHIRYHLSFHSSELVQNRKQNVKKLYIDTFIVIRIIQLLFLHKAENKTNLCRCDSKLNIIPVIHRPHNISWSSHLLLVCLFVLLLRNNTSNRVKTRVKLCSDLTFQIN